MTNSPTTPCPHCGVRSSGTFCPACGARLAAQGRFTPWQLVGLLGATAGVAVIWALSGPSRAGKSAAASAAAVPTAVAPDISSMSPREQFGRLADKVETAMESGDTATVVRFLPMAEQAWTNLTAADRDIDARFHVSLLWARVGQAPAALAQADTIQASVPSHLFADYLRAIIADVQADTSSARRSRTSFREHYAAEIALNRQEYQAHRAMLDQFLATIPTKRTN